MITYRFAIAVSSLLVACSSDIVLETGGSGGAGAQGGQGGGGASSTTGTAQGGEGGIDPVGPGPSTGAAGPGPGPSTGGGPGTGGSGPNDCPSACEGIYVCGTETNANGDPNCPNFSGDPGQQGQFVGACELACGQQPLLIDLVDPNDCEGTIETLKSLQPQFAQICGDNTMPPADCTDLCTTIYNCGLENMNCPGFTGDMMEQAAFVADCVPQCEMGPGLEQIVDPMNCAQTVNTLSQVSADFDAACQGMP